MKFTIAKSNNPISKKFSLEGGELVKNDGGNLTLATFDTQKDLTIRDLHNYVKSDGCHDRVIFIPGVSQHQDGLIVTKSEILRRERDGEESKQHLISRSKDCFSYVGGEGFILLDYDPNEDYTQNGGEPLCKEYLLNALFEVLPELKNAPMFWKTSSSSNISSRSKDADGNSVSTQHRAISGQHIFIAVEDTLDISRIVDIFYKRLWLNGHGYIFIDKTGRMHDRSIIDKVVNSPEREIFLKAECVAPVYQDIEYGLIGPDNKPLNTRSISNLTADEEMRVADMIDAAKRKKAKAADMIMGKYIKTMSAHIGMTPLRMKECIQNRILFGDTHIKLSTGVEITVSDLFENPDEYDGAYCYDPLEPEYGGITGGSTKAWIDLSNKRIHGHAHGGIHYELEFSKRKSPRQLAIQVSENEDHNILFKLAANGAREMRYIPTEIDQLISFIVDFAGLKASSAKKAFSEKYGISGGTYNSAGITVDLHSSALEDDGSVSAGMAQANLSIPIHHKFPHTLEKNGVDYKLDTVENFKFMSKIYQIQFSYDIIFKDANIEFPNQEVPDGDNAMNASISRVKSLCVLNGMGKDSSGYIADLVNETQLNPVLDWIKRVKWDGKSRMRIVQDGITVENYGHSNDDDVNFEFSNTYRDRSTRMWFIQCMASLDGATDSPLYSSTGSAVPKYEHILVFVGNQGIEKTKFLKSLLTFDLNQYILTGHELDLKDKDNVKIAISHWITELGELDSTFRKSDISALKAFMSKEDDQMRMPYARADSKFRRRTSFCGSVNDQKFLVDSTGNRRYLPLRVLSLLPLYILFVPWVTHDGMDIEIIKNIGEGFYVAEDDKEHCDMGVVNDAMDGDSGGNSVLFKPDIGYENGFTSTNSVYGIVVVDGGKKVAARYKCRQMSNDYETQQFWAEVYHYYCLGEQWWPSDELEEDLRLVLGEHQRVDPVIDSIDEKFDVTFNDDFRKKNFIRGDSFTTPIGDTTRFVTLTFKTVAQEIGVDYLNRLNTNTISNYLSSNGIKVKKYRTGKSTVTGVRLALKPGQQLFSDTSIIIANNA